MSNQAQNKIQGLFTDFQGLPDINFQALNVDISSHHYHISKFLVEMLNRLETVKTCFV